MPIYILVKRKKSIKIKYTYTQTDTDMSYLIDVFLLLQKQATTCNRCIDFVWLLLCLMFLGSDQHLYSTLLEGGGAQKETTLRSLVKMLIIVNHP